MSVEQVAPDALMTVEQFDQLPDVPGRQFELAGGRAIEMPTPGAMHNAIVGYLQAAVYFFVQQHNLGMAFGDNMGYILRRGPDEVRVPDVSFIAWERIPESGMPQGNWDSPPDLAVEVVSPSDNVREVERKVFRYLDAGVRLIWVVWPDEQTVTVYPANAAPHEVGSAGELDGGEVLPGFRVRVAELFALPLRPAQA